MTWFSILFFATWGFFLLKNIIVWTCGDIDSDVDFDGETDTDLSSIFSFKGILHFLLGFSSVLMGDALQNTNSMFIDYSFSATTYIYAVLIGIVFVVLLYYLYRFMLKLNHYTTDNVNLDNMVGKIYLIGEDGIYEVLIDTPNGTFKKTAYSENKDHKIGDTIVVRWNKEKQIYTFI